jgi:type I restriction enzyme S subunit
LPYPDYLPVNCPDEVKIPSAWETRRLKFAASCNDEALPETTDPDYEIAYVDISSVDLINGITAIEFQTFEEAPSRARRIVRDGDTIVSTVRTYLKAIASIVSPPENMIVSTGFAVIRPSNFVNSRFLGYALQNSAFVEGIVARSTGVSYPAINPSSLICLPVAYPKDKAEQQHIAAFLAWKTAQIDALIAKKQALIEKLKEKRLAVITQAVTKGLDPSVLLRDSGIPWLGEVPEYWVVGGFTKFVIHRADYRGKTPEKVKDGVFLVTARNIKSGHIDYETSQEFVLESEYGQIMSRGKPAIGDLLFTTEAPLGEVANIDREDIALAQRVIKFRGEPDKLNNYFAKYWMMSIGFQGDLTSLATGSTAKGIKASKLFALRCVIPPLNEQEEIVEYLNRKLRDFEEMESKVVDVINKLTEYRIALITAATTGKIDVRQIKFPAHA